MKKTLLKYDLYPDYPQTTASSVQPSKSTFNIKQKTLFSSYILYLIV